MAVSFMRVGPSRRSAHRLLQRFGPAALLPPAALAVHELRYLAAYGGSTSAELQRTGHSYLHSVVPWIVLLLALSAGAFLRSLGRALRGHSSGPSYTTSFAGLWLACTTALVAIFACQEFLEGLFAIGHPAGLAGIFGHGGWWALPFAAAIGLLLTACLHGARWALREAVRRYGARPRVRRARSTRARRPSLVALPTPVPVAGGWSGRGPPA